ncbi:MAG: Smr/MutS family protein [Deltaproteobacteria bacterium]|jgi:DNA-nicking Smr family endonuclease|nr:Smr/MutS family protein [Deltaproteobacteria bacterium]
MGKRKGLKKKVKPSHTSSSSPSASDERQVQPADSASDLRFRADDSSSGFLDGPFAGLAKLRNELLDVQRQAAFRKADQSKKELKAAKAEKRAAETRAIKPHPISAEEDQRFFEQAMAGVVPLADASFRREPTPKSPKSWKTPIHEDEDALALRELNDLVLGKVEFDFSATDEMVEAKVKGASEGLMHMLRQGRIPVQDHLDLHGLTLPEAEKAIAEFVTRSVYLGRTCLLLIHGRGHRSPGGVPILKLNLERLLLRSPIKKHILAFTTARPIDGGSGACYLLLRR